MAEPIAEYITRDYSAVDKQVEEIAAREHVRTQKLRIENYRRMGIILGAGLLVLGVFLVLAGIAYRIAYPPEPEIIEKVEIVEKIVEPQKIIIQTPPSTVVTQDDTPPPATQDSTSLTVIQEDTSSSINDNPPLTIWGEPEQKSTRDSAVSNDGDSSSSQSTSTTTIWGDIEQETTQDDTGGGDNESSNEQSTSDNISIQTSTNEEEDESVIGQRRVTTFTTLDSNLPEYGDVVTGWRWDHKDAKTPSYQYCYVNKDAGLNSLQVYLVDIPEGIGEPKSRYTIWNAQEVELTEYQWGNMEKKCRWWPN